jgi:plastocyanin
MRRSRRTLIVILGLVTALVALAFVSPGSEARGGHQRRGQQVKIQDDCDPATFNATFGPGVCVGKGRTTVDAFLAELAATHAAADWKFKPKMLRVHHGRPVILENEGGETHTFTLVDEFGGGFIGALNELTGNTEVAPECAQRAPDGTLIPQPPSPVNVFVEAGQEAAFSAAQLPPGTYRFQCCVHPWMRLVLTVR